MMLTLGHQNCQSFVTLDLGYIFYSYIGTLVCSSVHVCGLELYSLIYIFFFRYLFMYLKVGKEKERVQEGDSIIWFTHSIPTTAQAGPG